ncbi:phage portal protein [Bacillus sp. SIMBA_154]|uniref:phage portal protein n=1 Tax=Bacillus sp. SIMBA_154 TaxID=3080859 RepID=UPI003978C9E2
MAFFRSNNFRTETRDEDRSYDRMLDAILGNDGLSYTSVSAIKNSDIFTAVSTLASDIASSPISVLTNSVEDESEDVYKLLNERPNTYYSGFSLKYITVANALLNGQSFIEIMRDRHGNPIELIALRNSEVRIDQPKDLNEIVYYHNPIKSKKNSSERKIPADNMLHIKFFTLDGITGRSPLESLKYEIESQEAGKKLYIDFFRKGTLPGGILKLSKAAVNDGSREKARENFERAYSGTNNQQKVLVLDETMSFEQLQINTEVLNIVNNYSHGTKQIAKAFGLPPHKLGIEQVNTSLEQANLDYLTNTLSNYFAAIAAELNFKLLIYPYYQTKKFKFDTKRFRETDAKTKRENIIALLQNGIYSQNDALAEYGIAPIENGDRRFMSLNYVDVDIMDEIQKAKAKSLPIPSVSDEGGETD